MVIPIIGDNELENLKLASEEKEKFHRDELCRVANVIQEKGEDHVANCDCLEYNRLCLMLYLLRCRIHELY